MSTEPSCAHKPTQEESEWQTEHEPFLTVRVWLDYGPDSDRTMVNVKWLGAVETLGPLDKPHDLMFRAVMSAGNALEPVAKALLYVCGIAADAPRKES